MFQQRDAYCLRISVNNILCEPDKYFTNMSCVQQQQQHMLTYRDNEIFVILTCSLCMFVKIIFRSLITPSICVYQDL